MITAQTWKRVEAYYARPCELNERGEVLYAGENYPVGYIATEAPFAGYLVDTTNDRDKPVFKVNA